DRGRKAVELREHHQQAARENESEACYHPAVHAGKAGQLLGPVRRRWREPERHAIGRDGHAATHQDADKMEIGHRGAHGRVAIQVRPPREELRYCRRRRHGVVLLKGFGSGISRCPDHRCSARIPAGILPWRPESCSRGPTDESGHAVIEWYVKALFRYGGYWCARQRARAVVSAAASSLRCVVVPRIQRARALIAAAVLARTQLADRLRRTVSVERGELIGCLYHDG